MALFVTIWHQLKWTPVRSYGPDWLGDYVTHITVWNTATKNTVGDRKGTYRFDFGWFRPEAALRDCRRGSAATHDSFTLFHSGCRCDILLFRCNRKACTHITNQCLTKMMDNIHFKAFYVWMSPLAEVQYNKIYAKCLCVWVNTGALYFCMYLACVRLIVLRKLSKVCHCSRPDWNKQTINLPVMPDLKGTRIAWVKSSCTVLSVCLIEFLLVKMRWTPQNPSSCVQIADLCSTWFGRHR